MTNDRKLATVRYIDAIHPIDGADAIEVATVGGWKVVVKKGEFKPQDLVVYFEIDSFIPTDLAPFLTKPGKYSKEYNGVFGERLRSIRLRKQLSQGLVLPTEGTLLNYPDSIYAGVDVTEFLGIQKWEPPMNAQLAGICKGNFPSFIPKTDEERLQNLSRELNDWNTDESLTWEVTEKLDGSSMTIYLNNDVYGVCSRNLELKTEDKDNAFVATADAFDLESILRAVGRNLALQGELVSSGIQGNPYDFHNGVSYYYIYKIWDIDNQCYLTPEERRDFCDENRLKHVPVLETNASLFSLTMEELLQYANGNSVLNAKTKREGLVFKSKAGSFKAISNEWLLSGND